MNEDLRGRDTSNILIFFQFILYVAMISGYTGIAYYISLGIILLFVARILIKTCGKIPTNSGFNCFMLFYVFYALSTQVYYSGSNFYVYSAYYIICFTPLMFAEYIKLYSDDNMIKKSLKCLSFVFVGFCLVSIGYYIKNPGMAREMAAHLVEDRLAIGGGYSLAYAATIISVYLFSKLLNKSIKVNLIYILFIAICIYLVILTESAITLGSLACGLAVAILTSGKETSFNSIKAFVKFLFIIGVVGGTAYIVVSNKEAIGSYILSLIAGREDNTIYKRIQELVNMLVYGRDTYHLNLRNQTLTNSIEIFKQYPIFGMGYKYGNVFEYGKSMGMGNHSEILDSFARYGIIGAPLWLFPYFRTIGLIFKRNLGCVVAIVMMMFFNPFSSFHSNIVMFLFIPLFEEMLERIKKNSITNNQDEVK